MKASLLARVAPALLLGSVLASGVALPAFAQSGSSAAPPASGTTTAMPSKPTASTTHHTTAASSHKSTAQPESMTQRVNQRIADLHARLRITAQQEAQWQPFAQMMRDNASEIDASYRQRADKMQTMSAVDNMQSYAQIEQTRAQDVQKLVPAFQTLYTSLSDAQKKEADQLFRTYAENAQRRQSATK